MGGYFWSDVTFVYICKKVLCIVLSFLGWKTTSLVVELFFWLTRVWIYFWSSANKLPFLSWILMLVGKLYCLVLYTGMVKWVKEIRLLPFSRIIIIFGVYGGSCWDIILFCPIIDKITKTTYCFSLSFNYYPNLLVLIFFYVKGLC